jgi:hypothetical protein
MLKKAATIIIALLIVMVGVAGYAQTGNTYYVATDGSNSNNGSFDAPWATISYGAEQLSPGDVLYIRGGTYTGVVDISASGASSDDIYIMAYPNETPVIDGQGNVPANWGYLLRLSGDYITISGLEVTHSASVGVGVAGQHITVDGFYVHHSWDGGILVTGAHNIVENSEAWWNSTKREYGEGSGYWSWGMSAVETNDVTFRNNHVHENWGEGIGPFRCTNIVVEDNLIYDNFSGNLYLNNIDTAIVRRNTVYGIPNSTIEQGGASSPGIPLAMEDASPPLRNLTIINNIVYDTPTGGIYKWGSTPLQDSLIAHNTVIVPRDYAFRVQNASHSGNTVVNNIFSESYLTSSGFDCDYNLWTEGAPSAAQGPNDLTGNAGFVDSANNDYHLTSSSVAIDAGTNAGINDDKDGNTRPQGSGFDMGAYEYVSGSTPEPTNTPTPPEPTNTPNPTNTPTPSPMPTSTPEPSGETMTITITSNTVVTAVFEQNEYALTVVTVGEGSVDVTPSSPYYSGDEVTLTATEGEGWKFVEWQGDVSSTDNPLVITMTEDTSVTAVFEKEEYTLTTIVVGNGAVSKSPNQSTYQYGDVIVLEAIPETGWKFKEWQVQD